MRHDLHVSTLFFAIAESQKRTIDALIRLNELRAQQIGAGPLLDPATKGQPAAVAMQLLSEDITSTQTPEEASMVKPSEENHPGKISAFKLSSAKLQHQQSQQFSSPSQSPGNDTCSTSPRAIEPTSFTATLFSEKKVIGKKKLWRTMMVLNEKTGRQN